MCYFTHLQLQSAGLHMKQERHFYRSGMMTKGHKQIPTSDALLQLAAKNWCMGPTLSGLFIYTRQLNYWGKGGPYDIDLTEGNRNSVP